MKNKELKNSKINNEIYTPEYAILPLLPHLNKNWIVWECCYGKGDLVNHFRKKGFKVVGCSDEDFFKTVKAWFLTVWITKGLDLPYQINYYDLKKELNK